MDTSESGTERSRTIRSLQRRDVLVAGGLGAAMAAGCVGSDGGLPSDDAPAGDDDVRTGGFRLLISDQPVAIDEFDSLEVALDRARVFRAEEEGEDEDGNENDDADVDDADESGDEADDDASDDESADDGDDDADGGTNGFTTFDLTGASVDLTEVIGERAVPVIESELETGRYTKIELHVDDTEGIVDGEHVDVKVPSEKLQIVKPFEVTPDETLSFVFDINVIKRGQTGDYNLTPVIAESGVADEDVDVEEVDPESGGDDDGNGNGNDDADANANDDDEPAGNESAGPDDGDGPANEGTDE